MQQQNIGQSSDTGSIFVISSQVVSGQVGLKAVLPALRATGFEAVTLPSTLLAAHPAAFPAHGTPAGGPIDPIEMRDMGEWLIDAGALDTCRAVLTGYLPSPAHIDVAAQLTARLKAKNPDILYCCDPICGDHGRLYLPPEVMHGLRDRLLPMADMATPNLFELQILAGLEGFADEVEIIETARQFNVPQMLVTSAPAPEGRIAALLVGDEILRCETAKAPDAPHGMGDFFAALYLALYLSGEPKALGIAVATMTQMTLNNLQPASLPHGPVPLAAAAIQDKLPEPSLK